MLQGPFPRFVSAKAPRSAGRIKQDAKFTTVNEAYPIATRLAESDIRHDPLTSNSKRHCVRTQIVSPDLCGTLSPSAGGKPVKMSRFNY